MEQTGQRRSAAAHLGRRARAAALLILLLPFLLLAAAGCRAKKPEATTIHLVTWKPNVPEAWEEAYRAIREEHPEITVEVEDGVPLFIDSGRHAASWISRASRTRARRA